MAPPAMPQSKPKTYSLLAGQHERIQQYRQMMHQHRLFLLLLLCFLFLAMGTLCMIFAIKIQIYHAREMLSPQKIRAYYNGHSNKLVVEWITYNKTDNSLVWYGTKDLTKQAFGTQAKTIDDEGNKVYVHRVPLFGLLPNTEYKYKVGSDKVASPLGYFKIDGQGFFHVIEKLRHLEKAVNADMERNSEMLRATDLFKKVQKMIDDFNRKLGF